MGPSSQAQAQTTKTKQRRSTHFARAAATATVAVVANPPGPARAPLLGARSRSGMVPSPAPCSRSPWSRTLACSSEGEGAGGAPLTSSGSALDAEVAGSAPESIVTLPLANSTIAPSWSWDGDAARMGGWVEVSGGALDISGSISADFGDSGEGTAMGADAGGSASVVAGTGNCATPTSALCTSREKGLLEIGVDWMETWMKAWFEAIVGVNCTK
mmetsp:Transcript_18971/g.55187  ORF Transcript_18971/g.55187 Transcript_18971/m.55187 type:complete len:215 (-) Transcript_18971:1319-1963(-)